MYMKLADELVDEVMKSSMETFLQLLRSDTPDLLDDLCTKFEETHIVNGADEEAPLESMEDMVCDESIYSGGIAESVKVGWIASVLTKRFQAYLFG